MCAMLIAEGMWQQMAINSGATMQPGSYPERPGEPDCTYYLRTGLCRFGLSCRFNHPPDRNLVNIRLSQLWLCVIFALNHQMFCHYPTSLLLCTLAALLWTMYGWKKFILEPKALRIFFPFPMCLGCITEQNARSNVWKAKLWWCVYMIIIGI